jgi:hypothetical protein
MLVNDEAASLAGCGGKISSGSCSTGISTERPELERESQGVTPANQFARRGIYCAECLAVSPHYASNSWLTMPPT